MKSHAIISRKLKAKASLPVKHVTPETIQTDFSADKLLLDAGESVQFTDKSSLSPSFHAYDFGDGNFSNNPNPSHTYEVAGDYTAAKHSGNDGQNAADAGNVHTQAVQVEGIVDQIERDYSQTPKEAWSVRRVVRTYTGPCMRIRRTSDDAEKDIGFSASGILDTYEADAFIGNSKGYIKRWYGQRYGVDLVSDDNTSASQGKLNLSGPNLLPEMDAEGSSSIAYFISSLFSQSPAIDAHSVMRAPTRPNTRNTFLRGGPDVSEVLMAVWLSSEDLRVRDGNTTKNIDSSTWGYLAYTRAYISQTQLGIRWDNTSSSGSTSNSGTFERFGLGEPNNYAFNSYMNYQEILLYPEFLSAAARDDIWNDAKRFFNV